MGNRLQRQTISQYCATPVWEHAGDLTFESVALAGYIQKSMSDITRGTGWLDMDVKTWIADESFNFCFDLSCNHVQTMNAWCLAVGTDFGYLDLRYRSRWDSKSSQGLKNYGWTDSCTVAFFTQSCAFPSEPHAWWTMMLTLPLALLLREDFLRGLSWWGCSQIEWVTTTGCLFAAMC